MPTKAMFTLAKFIVIMLATVTSDTTLLALDTLGSATQI